jgi:hypothetical protein
MKAALPPSRTLWKGDDRGGDGERDGVDAER